jgi:hypothetical protein
MAATVRWVNVALGGVMEFGIIARLAYLGYQTGRSALVLFGFWGLVDFRQAGRWSEPLRLLQELVIMPPYT